MASARTLSKLHSLSECLICAKLYTDARILDCGHQFCENCLTSTQVKHTDGLIVCVVCNHGLRPPNGDAALLPLSRIHGYTIALCLEGVSNRIILCSRCNIQEPKVHCQECSEDKAYMCDNCFITHQKVPRLETRKTVDFKKEFVCTVHTKKMVECYCHDCQTALCTECIFHHDHCEQP